MPIGSFENYKGNPSARKDIHVEAVLGCNKSIEINLQQKTKCGKFTGG